MTISIVNDFEIRASLHGLRPDVLDALPSKNLLDLASHLRKIADYAEARAWVLTADRYGPRLIDEEKERRAAKIMTEMGLALDPDPKDPTPPDPST